MTVTLTHVEVAHVVERPFSVPAYNDEGEEVVRWIDNSGVYVVGHDAAGREYTHETIKFEDEFKAYRLVARVRAAGMVIDEDRWIVRVPYGSQAWIDDDMEVTLMDDEERMAHGL